MIIVPEILKPTGHLTLYIYIQIRPQMYLYLSQVQ